MAQHPVNSFTDRDVKGIDHNLNDPMVISIVTTNFLVKKVLIDQGSLADLLYVLTLGRMGIPDEDLKPFSENLIGFSGEQVGIRGYIDLLTSFGTPSSKRSTFDTWWLTVRCHTTHYSAAYLSTLWGQLYQPFIWQ